MPIADVNGLRIYYEVCGEGEPLLLIAGLNSDLRMYRAMIPPLSKRCRVVAFDNRGIGRIDKPDIPCSVEMMADDAAGLLKALDAAPAHVLGTSLGGRVAADLAIRHPQLVKSLILVSTILQPGPPSWSRTMMNLMLRGPLIRGSHPYRSVERQIEASRAYNAMDKLSAIHAPTLILHGRKDSLAPHGWAERIHSGIHGSKMISYNGGHLFFIWQAREVVDAVTAFVASDPDQPPGR